MFNFGEKSMNVIHNIFRLLMLGIFASILSACSSSGTRSTYDTGYYNTNNYDAYYRRGIDRHHQRNYRNPRPVRQPIRRR